MCSNRGNRHIYSNIAYDPISPVSYRLLFTKFTKIS